MSTAGNIESFSFCPSLSGWLILGWIGFGWDDEDSACEVTLAFDLETIAAEPVVCVFERADVREVGTGVVMLVPDQCDLPRVRPHDITLRRGSYTFHSAMASAQAVDPAAEISHARHLIAHAVRSDQWTALVGLLDRPLFTGPDTIDNFSRPVFVQVDQACVCPPHGLLLLGWYLDPFKTVMRLRMRCGSRSAQLDPDRWITIPRPDVRDGFSTRFGGLSANCGFMAYLPQVYVPGQTPYIEVETVHAEIGFKSMAAVRSSGIDTIKDILSRIDIRYDDLVKGYDWVVGPAVEAINTFRLGGGAAHTRIDFGTPAAAPRCTIIVPVHGRIEFMEYQLAFLSRTLSREHELLYVLDDPEKLRATEVLAASCLARFEYPFSLITLVDNVGYAPANNVGLRLARGRYTCFLNSDVFPGEPEWLEYMLSTAEAEPRPGVVGALLLFEDDTIQHDGCVYETIPEFGGWIFCIHPNKGLMPEHGDDVHHVAAVTGACFVTPTDLAREVGGFDEGYVIGDFEDADLCEKIKATGRICVVNRRARLYHLERQSQGGHQTSWRLNLTLYNAWRFQKRWPAPAAAIADLPRQ